MAEWQTHLLQKQAVEIPCGFKSLYGHQFIMNKKEINERKAEEIHNAISTPEGRMILAATMWFPMEIPLIGETKLEWAERKIAQMQYEQYEKEFGRVQL